MWCNERPFVRPVQLIEVVLDLLMIEVCLYVRKKSGRDGLMYPAFAVGYGVYRFALEFLRDTPKLFGVFTHSQLWAVLCIILGLVLYAIMRRGAKAKRA